MRPLQLHMLLHDMCRHRRRSCGGMRLLLPIHGGTAALPSAHAHVPQLTDAEFAVTCLSGLLRWASLREAPNSAQRHWLGHATPLVCVQCAGGGHGADGAVSMDRLCGLAGAQAVAAHLVGHLWRSVCVHDHPDLLQGTSNRCVTMSTISVEATRPLRLTAQALFGALQQRHQLAESSQSSNHSTRGRSLRAH